MLVVPRTVATLDASVARVLERIGPASVDAGPAHDLTGT